MIKTLFATMFAVSTASFAGDAAAPQSAPVQPTQFCQTQEYRQLDFWVGDWKASFTNSDGSIGTGRNIITIEKDGCVIEENFDSAGLSGNSLSLYHAPTKLWRQTWVDNQGDYFDLTGGPTDDGGFMLTNIRLNDKAPHLRMRWDNITPASFDWYWEKSEDGKVWTLSWHIKYERNE